MVDICGEEDDFATHGLRAFNHIFQDIVRPVRSGALRAQPGKEGKVTVLVGGGSGHYPTFCGFVGPGFADAVVMGGIFASPSIQAVATIGRLAHRGGGIVMGFGNYAGDNLNFGIAAERLRAEGIDTRIVVTTDDVASAPSDTPERRRGVAGDIIVFKIMGAAADEGYDIDAVEAVSRKANDHTRSFGIAFDGCALPGAPEKIFTVAEGRMALGLGIHGEPGIEERDIAAPAEIAAELYQRVMAERPPEARRLAVLLNGAGATATEELFVLWNELEVLFERDGLTLVAPLVGSYATSLDMYGCSLTITWLDQELERFWRAPVNSPALCRHAVEGDWVPASRQSVAELPVHYERAETADAARAGQCIARAMALLSRTMQEHEAMLGRIDAIAGDGDHGQGMARGARAAARGARRAADEGAGARTVMEAAADAWGDRAGGTSGALWGEALFAFSTLLDDRSSLSAATVRQGMIKAARRVRQIGKAEPGDKTLVDALAPFVSALEEARPEAETIAASWNKAVARAHEGAEATKAFAARRGRAKTHGNHSLGHPDPGALSFALAMEALAALMDDLA
ncbi:dihydroxyacetone kinase family protein [Asaia krungthepensis]|uniref:Dihydroxyacetone kinase n=1 Tax=Asaia krungthepensis NRIC 0535 TaxID=1307925 RepID=A0ABQ0PX83_9PROT|nr:dihydroxyacetone kinase family protein [Asaia krungthepensis]GBQ83818.1 dihydroxyacetone kinase [Asaia krungthepensis NRIC 0535]